MGACVNTYILKYRATILWVCSVSIWVPCFTNCAWSVEEMKIQHSVGSLEKIEFSKIGFAGVSFAGAEFGVTKTGFSNLSPGKVGVDYHFNSTKHIKFFNQEGIQFFRIPLRWERIQPELGGPLDLKHLQYIREFAAKASRVGGYLILDIHNYGRYALQSNGIIRSWICLLYTSPSPRDS